MVAERKEEEEEEKRVNSITESSSKSKASFVVVLGRIHRKALCKSHLPKEIFSTPHCTGLHTSFSYKLLLTANISREIRTEYYDIHDNILR